MSTEGKPEVKPCPVCGSKSFFIERTHVNGKPDYVLIGCDGCQYRETEDVWNRRAMPDCVSHLLEQLFYDECSDEALKIVKEVEKYYAK